MNIKKLEAVVEAILFSMGEAVEIERLAAAVDHDEDTVRKIIRSMMTRYDEEDRGIHLIELDGSFQLCTKPEMYEYLIKVAHIPKKHVLTDVLLETLSIVATSQPIRLSQKDVDLNKDELNREKSKNVGNGWDNTTGKWRYLVDGNPITDEWKTANGKWFYLDIDGNMVTDKLIEDTNGPIYYVDKYGAMVTETWKAVALEESDEDLVKDADYWWT